MVRKRKVSVWLSGELLSKIEEWRAKGFSLSDTVRLGLTFLPNSPEEMLYKPDALPSKIRPLSKGDFQLQSKDEKEALRALQEW
jgi:Arc/MetJ-type ribon-helix-helix transcriptional regulator